MKEDRKKSGATFWATVVVVGLALYIASFGPACWLVERCIVSARHATIAYDPCLYLESKFPSAVRNSVSACMSSCGIEAGFTTLRDEPFWRHYPIGDLAFPLDDGRPEFKEALLSLSNMITTTVEPDSWEELSGRGVLRIDAESKSLHVFQSRRGHSALSDHLAEMREIKNSKQRIRGLDLTGVYRVWCGRHGHGYSRAYFLQAELLSRALVIGSPDGKILQANGERVADVDGLITFLDRQSRPVLRRGVFWNTKMYGPDGIVNQRLQAFCRSNDVDLFIERGVNCLGSCAPDIQWEVQANDSVYLD